MCITANLNSKFFKYFLQEDPTPYTAFGEASGKGGGTCETRVLSPGDGMLLKNG
jgi:hypothetical protein